MPVERSRPEAPNVQSRRASWRLALGWAICLVALVLIFAPGRSRTVECGPLQLVEANAPDDPAHPATARGGRPVLVSPFIDLGRAATLTRLTVEGASAAGVFLRSARRTRAFLIPVPPPGPLRWSPLGREVSVRRVVQLAVPATDARGVVRLRLTCRAPNWSLLPFWIAGGLALLWPQLMRLARRIAPALRAQAWAIGAGLIAVAIALFTMIGPLPFVAHGDETFTVGMAEQLLTTGDYRMPLFKYPHLHGYLQAAGTVAYGIGRAATGRLAYHDPFTNRLYYDGQPLAKERLFQADFAARMAAEALPSLRRAYALGIGVLVVLAFALGACVRSPRAGLVAAAATAVQPVLRDAALLPNTTSALLAVGAGLLFLRLSPGTAGAFWKGLAAGIVIGWKFNPTFAVLLLAVVLIENPAGTRALRSLIALAAAPVGFLVAFPDLLWQIPRFGASVAREAFNYSSAPHPVFATDDALPFAVYQVHLRPDDPGNVALALLAGVGALVIALKAPWRSKWVLLWPPVGGAAFMLAQFLQLGRNYAIPVAYACVLAGVGADVLLDAVRRRWGRPGALVAGALIVLAPLGVLVRAQAEERGLAGTARSQAIAWIDAHASLGDRVILVESGLDELEGRQPDRARFQVRRRDAVPEDRPGKEADYLVVNETLGAAMPGRATLRARFAGRAVWGASPGYAVYQTTGQHQPPAPLKADP